MCNMFISINIAIATWCVTLTNGNILNLINTASSPNDLTVNHHLAKIEKPTNLFKLVADKPYIYEKGKINFDEKIELSNLQNNEGGQVENINNYNKILSTVLKQNDSVQTSLDKLNSSSSSSIEVPTYGIPNLRKKLNWNENLEPKYPAIIKDVYRFPTILDSNWDSPFQINNMIGKRTILKTDSLPSSKNTISLTGFKPTDDKESYFETAVEKSVPNSEDGTSEKSYSFSYSRKEYTDNDGKTRGTLEYSKNGDDGHKIEYKINNSQNETNASPRNKSAEVVVTKVKNKEDEKKLLEIMHRPKEPYTVVGNGNIDGEERTILLSIVPNKDDKSNDGQQSQLLSNAIKNTKLNEPFFGINDENDKLPLDPDKYFVELVSLSKNDDVPIIKDSLISKNKLLLKDKNKSLTVDEIYKTNPENYLDNFLTYLHRYPATNLKKYVELYDVNVESRNDDNSFFYSQ